MPFRRLQEINGRLLELIPNEAWALLDERDFLKASLGVNSAPTQRSYDEELTRARREKDRLRKASVRGMSAECPQTIPPKEKNQTPLPPETLRVSTPKGKRLPEDWCPSENLWSWGKTELGLPPETLKFETSSFRDHFWASARANAVKKDWDRAWKNWMREAKRRTKGKPATNGHAPVGEPKRLYREILAEKSK